MQSQKRQRGVTLIEVLASLGIMTLVLGGLTMITLNVVEDSKSQQAALYQSQIVRAVKNWLGDAANRNTVATTANTTTPVKITLAQLAQWLPPNFSAANSYRQSPCVMAYYNAGADRIETAITTEGGDAIDDAQLGYVVNYAGEGAGAVYASNAGTARGPYGTWQAPLANYTSAVAANRCSAAPATAGRLISLLAMDRNGTNALGGAGEWLARNAIAGRPDLNRMNTSIDMNGNDISNARHVNAQQWVAANVGVLSGWDVVSLNGNFYAPNGNVTTRDGFLSGVTLPTGNIARLSQAVFYADTITNGAVVPKPTSCPSGIVQIFASPTSMAATVAGQPVQTFASTVIDISGVPTQWQPALYLLTSVGWVFADPAYTSLNISVKCS